MVFKAQRVAVIGAGVSGLAAAKHLKAAGIQDIVVYERSASSGGVWIYDERKPLEPKYPSVRPSVADFVVGEEAGKHDIEEVKLLHAPPSPAYDGLTNNISTVLLQLKDYPWKEGTGDFVKVGVLGDYLQGYSRTFKVEPLIRFNTRVEKLEKIGGKWHLDSSTLITSGPEAGRKTQQSDEFDAVIVASGHYHASRVPDTPGLAEWKAAWPSSVSHSKSYRHPEPFKDKTVLLIGAGVSSTDIAREISPLAKAIYQSSRGSSWDLPVAFLPPKTTRVAEISSFQLPSPTNGTISSSIITLKDGTTLTGIDEVIISTGYHVSYPFLLPLHADTTAPEAADAKTLVTDGTMVHNLHKDIFYIPDPTLAFVGTSYYVSTFTLFEFQAIAAAAVFSGHAELPSQSKMEKEYKDKLEKKGVGREFHSLKDEEVAYVDDLVQWLNEDAEQTGGAKVEGHSERWLEEDKLKLEKIKKNFENEEVIGTLKEGEKGFAGSCEVLDKASQDEQVVST